MVGNFEGCILCFLLSCNLLELYGSVYEWLIGESSFGGSFGYDEMDGDVFGGNLCFFVIDDV